MTVLMEHPGLTLNSVPGVQFTRAFSHAGPRAACRERPYAKGNIAADTPKAELCDAITVAM